MSAVSSQLFRLSLVCILTLGSISGCTRPRQTTAVGAATGGALGAGLGAIVGNQTGNAGSGLAIGAVAGAAAGSLIGNALEAQQETTRSQSEALERQESMIAAQRSEIAELRHLNSDVVEQKRLALQKRGPSPYSVSTRSIASTPERIPAPKASDPLARLKLPQKSAPEPVKKKVLNSSERPVAKQVPPAPAVADSCSGAESERVAAENSSESSDKLFHLRRALRLCPNNARVHHELGKVYASMDRKEDAQDEFKEALQIDPSYAPAKESLHIGEGA